MEHLGTGITLLPGFERTPLLLDLGELSSSEPRERNFNTFPERHGWEFRDDGKFMEKSCAVHRRHNSKVCHDGQCLTGAVSHDQTSWNRLAAFLQRWLYFEVLREFFDDGTTTFRFLDFVKPDPQRAGRQWITTEKLNSYLSEWETRHSSPSWRGTSQQKARLIRTQNVLDRSRHFIANHCAAGADFFWYIDEDVALSLMVLGEALTHALVRLQTDLKIIPEGWYDLDVSRQSYGYSEKVLNELREKGWCLRTVSMLKTLLKGNTIGLLLVLPHVTQAHMHVVCTEDLCYARQTRSDLELMKRRGGPALTAAILQFVAPDIKPAHMGPRLCKWAKNHGSNLECSMKGPEISELLEIIDNGGVPLLWWDEENSSVKVKPMYKWDTDYVIFSHVWSDGYGNENDNTMHECVIRALDEICRNVWRKASLTHSRRPSSARISLHSGLFSRPLSRVQSQTHFAMQGLTQIKSSLPRSHYFWIDTLAIPIANSTHARAVRAKAIANMHRIYRNASYTVVFEKDLSKVAMNNATTGAVKISISRWMSRLWTLQEGVLSTNLLFNFSDDLYSLKEIEDQMAAQEQDDGAETHKCVSRVAQAYYDGLLGNQRNYRACLGPDEQIATANFVASVWRAVQWRRLSKIKHQTLALSILLGIDTEGIAPESDHPEDDVTLTEIGHTQSMERLYERLARLEPCAIPAGMIFLPGNKLSRSGYRWAPANWLLDQATLSPDPLAADAPPPQFFFGPDESIIGLGVTFPGLILHKLVNQDDWFQDLDVFHFPVHRTLNDWYRVRRADDAPLPVGNLPNDRTLGIITMHWPLTEGEEIALLVSVPKNVKPSKSPDIGAESSTRESLLSCVDTEILNRIWISREHKPAIVEDHRGKFHQDDFGAILCGEPIGPQRWLVGGQGSIEEEQHSVAPSALNSMFSLVRRLSLVQRATRTLSRRF